MAHRKLLPPATPDYAIADRRPDHFTRGSETLLEDIGRKMDVAQARTEGRIPSPFSRAFIFFLNLYGRSLGDGDQSSDDVEDSISGTGRTSLREQARATLRGICAVFALRKALNVEIRLDAVEIMPGRSTVETVLLPAIDSAPRGSEFWNPIRFYTVRQSERSAPEVLAGLSPMTAIYPAAASPKRLRSIFWYDANTGTWYDPTSSKLSEDGRFRVSRATQMKVSALLKAWVNEAIARLSRPGALEHFGLEPLDRTDLLAEFKLWRDNIGGKAAADVIPTEDAGIPRSRTASNAVESLPFLDHACESTPEHIISDLPVHESPAYGTVLLVTRDQILNRGTRIYGRTFGSTDLEARVDDLSSYGDNLGLDLGFTDEHLIPMRYVYVDRLFAKRLTYLNDTGLSKEWSGLEIGKEYYFLPFEPEILNYLPPDDLAENTSGRLMPDGDAYEVTLRFGSTDIRKSYSVRGGTEYVADATTIPPGSFDLRVFPNVNLDQLPDGTLHPDDHRYYARLRQAPKWPDMGTFHYRENGTVSLDQGTSARTGRFDDVPGDGFYAAGETLFITCKTAPDGFYVRSHGICLLRLPPPSGTQETWDVGVDFGTSNTCVAYRSGAVDPTTIDFPVLTTTFFKNPSYNARFSSPHGGEINERASAMYDFFYRKAESNTDPLNAKSYFPTQIITQQSEVQDTPKWDFENGLIYFRNFALSSEGEGKELIEVFGDYVREHSSSPRLPVQRFRAKQDIKWENTAWLETFMRHLRLQLVMTAASNNAKIGEITFSYPKAFSIGERDNFQTVLRRVWSREVSNGSFLVSESEAVREYIVRQSGQYVVYDIGGGTTDVISFDRETPIYQTSFKVAARQVNNYVVESTRLRKAFQEAFKQVVTPAKYQLILKNGEEFLKGDEMLATSMWVGHLDYLEGRQHGEQDLRDILSLLRTGSDAVADEETRRAVQGFFLSISILFSGLAFYGGALMSAYGTGNVLNANGTVDLDTIDVILTGNGSKLYRMIDHNTRSFDPVIQAMVRSGVETYRKHAEQMAAAKKTAAADPSGASREQTTDQRAASTPADDVRVKFSGIYSNGGTAAPKSTVALGLLTTSGDDAQAQDVPVANLVGEAGYDVGNQETDFDGSLVDYYEFAAENPRDFQVPRTIPPFLEAFLDALHEQLPRGNNQGLSVIPEIGPNWHEHLKTDLYRNSRVAITTRISNNAEDFQKKLQRVDAANLPALESLFVIELYALLDAIREAYAVPK